MPAVLASRLPLQSVAMPRADRHVVVWRWGTKYAIDYATRLLAGVGRWLSSPYNITFCAPQPEDAHLTEIPGCFARLRTFDPAWQADCGFQPGDQILVLDLDLIITGPLDHLFEDDAPFRILQGVNSSNPCPMNGSVWRLTAGYRPDVWTDFSLEAAARVPHDKFPDDQAWFAHKLPEAAAYGPENGVYAYQKPGWPRGEALPKNASVVAFPGWRDPSGFQGLSWVKQHWLGEPVL